MEKETDLHDEQKLRTERADLTWRISGERESRITYAQRLPVELLVEVFLHVCSASSYTLSISGRDIWTQHGREFDFSAPSLTLSQVSHLWREVAFSCPRLWTSIEVDLRQISGRYEAVLSTYLRNSACRSLIIKIRDSGIWYHGGDYREDHLGENGVTILDTILSQSSRIEYLEFCGFRPFYGLPHDRKYPFPLLRRFETDVGMEGMEHRNGSFVESLNEAPLLDTISIAAPFPNSAPYGQLTCLTMQRTRHWLDFDHILRGCPNLQILEVTYHDMFSPMREIRPIVLPSLRSMSLKAEPSLSFRHALPLRFQVPNLYYLHLTCRGFDAYEWPSPAFINMLQSCSSSLGRLSICLSRSLLIKPAIPQILDLLPQLTHFDISSQRDVSGLTETILSILTIPVSSKDTSLSIVLPRLSTLSVTICDGLDVFGEKVGQLIVKMMTSRSRKSLLELGKPDQLATLTHATFDFRDPRLADQVEEQPRLEALRRLLEITNMAQLDSDITLHVLVGQRISMAD